MPLAPRVLAQQSTATQDDHLSWVGCQPVAPHTPSSWVLILRTPYTTRSGDMQDPATQLPRIPLLRRWVNKRSVSYYVHPLDRVPGIEEQPPAGSLIVVEHDAPVAHALQVAADLLRLAVLFPRHELQLHGLVYPVVEFHQASSTLDASPRRWEQ